MVYDVTDRGDPPVFGERTPGATYIRRPSAYAIVQNDRAQVAVVRTRKGVFLPGGGVESGEIPEQAVLRETLEECGFAIRLLSRLPDAVQFVHARAETRHYEKICTFFVAAVEGDRTATPEHEVLWLAPDVAATLLSHESHRWALDLVSEDGGQEPL